MGTRALSSENPSCFPFSELTYRYLTRGSNCQWKSQAIGTGLHQLAVLLLLRWPPLVCSTDVLLLGLNPSAIYLAYLFCSLHSHITMVSRLTLVGISSLGH